MLADIRKMLSVHIPDARKALLLTEIDRVRQVWCLGQSLIKCKVLKHWKVLVDVYLLAYTRSFSESIYDYVLTNQLQELLG